MTERIQTFTKTGEFAGTQEKNEFYANQNNINHELAAGSVSCFLVNKQGKIYIVKRGKTEDSPGLFDKTASGHLQEGETTGEAIRRELYEEIGVNAIIAKDEEEFEELRKTTDTTKNAILKIIDIDPWYCVKVKKGGKIIERIFNVSLFMGKYDGDVQYNDGEADEYVLLSPEELHKIIKEEQKEIKITESLIHLMKKYGEKLLEIIND